VLWEYLVAIKVENANVTIIEENMNLFGLSVFFLNIHHLLVQGESFYCSVWLPLRGKHWGRGTSDPATPHLHQAASIVTMTEAKERARGGGSEGTGRGRVVPLSYFRGAAQEVGGGRERPSAKQDWQ